MPKLPSKITRATKPKTKAIAIPKPKAAETENVPKLYAISCKTSFTEDQIFVVEATSPLAAHQHMQTILASTKYMKVRLNDKAKTEAIILSANIQIVKVLPYKEKP